jgi:hypothetical protein
MTRRVPAWLANRGLTLVLITLFLLFWAGQIVAGYLDENTERREHARPQIDFATYVRSPEQWEATFENWESEFLQMSAFVLLTMVLVQKGSAESRRPGVIEAVDIDPRHFRGELTAPWPVRRGGAWLWLYERSLSLAFAALFLLSWIGHWLAGWRAEAIRAVEEHRVPPTSIEFLHSPTLWFQSLQNWQSEFLAIASMVYLTVYLRQRGSPESKPVHVAHTETGR